MGRFFILLSSANEIPMRQKQCSLFFVLVELVIVLEILMLIHSEGVQTRTLGGGCSLTWSAFCDHILPSLKVPLVAV